MLSISLVMLMSGLVLGVFAMLHGTERKVRPVVAPHERLSEHDPAAEPSPLFNLASFAAFTVGFGLSAYFLTRNTVWPIAAQVVIAAVAGAFAMTVQSVLIARWAIPGARAGQMDERFLLQGTIGRLTQPIPAHGIGELRYALDQREYLVPTRSLDGAAVANGTDVVIERVEQGVAYIELWDSVEQRL